MSLQPQGLRRETLHAVPGRLDEAASAFNEAYRLSTNGDDKVATYQALPIRLSAEAILPFNLVDKLTKLIVIVAVPRTKEPQSRNLVGAHGLLTCRADNRGARGGPEARWDVFRVAPNSTVPSSAPICRAQLQAAQILQNASQCLLPAFTFWGLSSCL